MRLYGFYRSTATWRARIALSYKGLSYDYVPVHLQRDGGEQLRPEFAEKNPMRHVPVLELDLDGTQRKIAESMAILELLEERFPTPSLLPQDTFLRARARQLALLVVSGIQPLQNTAVQRWVKGELHADEVAWSRHWVTRGLTALESLVSETAGQFAVGDQVSFADLCIVPQMHFSRRFGVDLTPYPTLVGIDARCALLPAFQAAHADNQPDTERLEQRASHARRVGTRRWSPRNTEGPSP